MKFITLLFLVTFLIAAQPAFSNDKKIDHRTSLNLTPAEKVEFLSEMRMMLTSIQGIMEGIGTENIEKIKESARYSGNRMARATPQSIRDKLPMEFKQLGGPTHLAFEELVIRSDTDDMEDLASFTAELMKRCLTCHELYKVD